MIGNPFRSGFKALESRDFARAETFFARIVRRNPRDAEAHFYLGATRMDLGMWQDAKQHLEIAAAKIADHPDPISRLGVTYAKLGDAAGARSLRAELVEMADACGNNCRLSPYIVSGIEMIDEALAQH